MVKVKTLKIWEDLKAKQLRKPGTENAIFECEQERYDEIVEKLGNGYVELIEEPKKANMKVTKKVTE